MASSPARRTRTRPTSRGRWIFKLGLFFLVIGILTLETPLVQLSLLVLMVLPLAAILSRYNLSRLEYEARLPDRVFALKPFTAHLQLRNRSRFFPRFTIAVDDAILNTAANHWLATWVGPRGVTQADRPTHMLHRGRVAPSAVVLRSSFPFGLYETEHRDVVPHDLVIYPAPLFPNRGKQWTEDLFHDPETTLLDQPRDTGEFRSVRDFRHGDRLKAVHWVASLRHGDLLVRDFDPPLADAYSFVFHSFRPDGVILTQQGFERCMQLLCGFFLRCHERGIPFDFTASFHGWRTVEVRTEAQLDRALELLAEARQRPERDPKRLVKRIGEHTRVHRCFVVSNTPLEHWQHLMLAFEHPVECVDAHTWRSTLRHRSAV